MSETDPQQIPVARPKHDIVLRDHIYDGIQEYDQRLPNWWLWTLYAAMIFSFAYWAYYHRTEIAGTQETRFQKEMAAVMLAAASGGADLTDDQLWTMSKDPTVIAAGKQTYVTTCASCHGPDLKGGIGVNLTDAEWIHGGKPTEIISTVKNGVLAKGMPTWGPVLGQTRIAEVAAFVLSHHSPPQ